MSHVWELEVEASMGFGTDKNEAGAGTRASKSSGRRLHPLVLVADDNEMSARAFAEFLRSRNFDVVLAHDGIEACEVTNRTHPDVILMDVEMPRLDGIEATRRIRASNDPDVTSTPIIALTGFATREEADICYEAGATCFLGKPIGLVKLIQTVESALHLPMQG